MKLYVLAAGYGTRLGARGRHQAKALIEVAGRPILSHLLDRAWALDAVDETIVVSNHRFVSDFETWKRTAPRERPLKVLDDGSTSAENRLGAIGDLAFAFERIPPGNDASLVMASDNLLDLDLAPAYEAFLEHGKTTLLVRHRHDEPAGNSRYNEVQVDPEGNVTRFREKPERPESPLAAIAVYFFPSNIQTLLGVYLAGGGERDAPGRFIAWLVNETPVRAVALEGLEDHWHDIGDPEGLARAQSRFGGEES